MIDATDQVVGRLAVQIANILRGKHRPEYTPHLDTGEFVIVINAEKIRFTGKKWQTKTYHWYTRYPGGLKMVPARDLLQKHPERILREAVRRMVPRNQLGRQQMTKLKIYAGPTHPHQAQQPEGIQAGSVITESQIVAEPNDEEDLLPGHRPAQDVGGPRPPDRRHRQDRHQRPSLERLFHRGQGPQRRRSARWKLTEMRNRLDCSAQRPRRRHHRPGRRDLPGRRPRPEEDVRPRPPPAQEGADGDETTSSNMAKKLRDSGYLTRDGRMKERKKYGRKGGRKSFQFSKR